MKQPELLFVHQMAFDQDKWHLRVTNCGPTHTGDWPWEEGCSRFLSSGRQVWMTHPYRSCDTSPPLQGPISIHGRDPSIGKLKWPINTFTTMAQGEEVVFVDGDLSEEPLPQFLSAEMTVCEHFEYIVQFTSPFLQDLPEVIDYVRKQEEGAKRFDAMYGRDRWSGMLTPKLTPKSLIPTGIWFPGGIACGGSVVENAYKIKEWRKDHTAVVDCYMSQRMIIGSQAFLKRRVPWLGSESVLGKIIGFLQQ